MLNQIGQFGIFTAGILFSLVLTVIFQGSFESFFVRLFGRYRVRSKRDIRGLWIISYTYLSAGTMKVDHLLIDIKQVGKNFRGISKNTEYGQYAIKGDIESETYITGKWESRIEDDIHNGSFQTILRHVGKEADGKWIGFNSESKVLDGPIIWKKLSNKRTKRKEIISKIKDVGIIQYLQESNIHIDFN